MSRRGSSGTALVLIVLGVLAWAAAGACAWIGIYGADTGQEVDRNNPRAAAAAFTNQALTAATAQSKAIAAGLSAMGFAIAGGLCFLGVPIIERAGSSNGRPSG